MADPPNENYIEQPSDVPGVADSEQSPRVDCAQESVVLSSILSLDASKKNPIHSLEPHVIVTFAGSTVVILNTETLEQKYLWGQDGGGIGAVAVHPSREYFAVAEKCARRAPNVYIYNYPQLQLVSVLKDGTERAFSAAAFDKKGDMLATVGSYPDYMLTLWDWKKECVTLRAKAFSQEVYTVEFSPYFDGHLITSGTGHIRFWKMASTFTGLKLQGSLGKFGKIELTDVYAFIEMEDGKVLSGTESGELLLWDGGLIKAVLTRHGGKPCHDGAVSVVEHDVKAGHIITAGNDGFVRIWDFNMIRDAEPPDDAVTVEISPADEVKISEDCLIKSLIWDSKQWVIFAESGAIFKVTLPDIGPVSKGERPKMLLEFNSAGFAGLETLDGERCAITAGKDGSVRLYNYLEKEQLHCSQFCSPASQLLLLPATLDPERRTILVGFEDGTLRALGRCADGLKLLCALKPHKTSINAISVSPTTRRMATASSDGRLFFFDIENMHTYVPIAYSTLHSPINTLAFTSCGTSVLVGCANGQILKVEAPTPTTSGEASLEREFPSEIFDFKVPKSPKRRKEEDDKENVENQDAEAPQNDDNTQPGTASNEDTGENGQGGKAEAEEEEEEVDPFAEGKTPVHTILFSSEDQFFVAFGGALAGKVFQCSLETKETLSTISAPAAATTVLRFGSSREFLLMGSCDGMIQMCTVPKTANAPYSPCWERGIHDGQSGRVTGVALSHDDRYLLSVAEDMTFYVQEVKVEVVNRAPLLEETPELPSLAEDGTPKAKDITDASAYTIEEAKQKEEQDSLLAAADAKKRRVKDYLGNLRAQFEELVAENAARPPGRSFSEDVFEIDPSLKDMIEEQTQEREEIARREMQWDREKKRLALLKLEERYLNQVEVERTALWGFGSHSYLTCFRTEKLPEGIKEHMKHLKAKIEMENNSEETRDSNVGFGNSGQGSGEHGGGAFVKGTVGFMTDSFDIESNSKFTKADLRRIARKKREEHWGAYNSMRPSEDQENPADLAAIREAEMTMGDFKLKTDPAYVVPKEERMTPDKKRYQMLTLENGIHSLKMAFNEEFMNLRDAKRRACIEISQKNEKLREINNQLDIKDVIVNPAMLPEETPESRQIATDADIASFVSQCEESTKKNAESFGGFGGGGNKNKTPKELPKSSLSDEKTPNGAARDTDPLASILSHIPPSDLEKEESCFRRRHLELERERILGEIRDIVEPFDNALQGLKREKFMREADVKYAEMRRLVMFKELGLLNEFQKREVVLSTKLQDKMADRAMILEKISECQGRLEQKKVELDELEGRQTAVVAEFDELVPENHDFREQLSKIFFRKMKRSKKRSGGDEDDDYDSDEDYDDDDFDDDEEDDEEEEEVCPADCDQDLYAKVCDQREKRLDEEELLADFQKSIEQIKKDKEQASKKLKLVEQSLTAINSDIMEFQKEKQGKLNELDVLVMIKMNQVEYLIDERVPKDLSETLVFSKEQLKRLKNRILELDDERLELRKKQRELRKDYVQLTRDKKLKEGKIEELETRMYDVQLLKFGQVIDLDLLDRVQMSQGTGEIKEQVRLQEKKLARELAQWDRKIMIRTEELAAVTSDNTKCLNTISDLTRFQMNIEKTLTTSQNRMLADPDSQRRKETAAREELVHTVNEQAARIETMKKQLMALKRKDTSVYG
ncbi:hypothetical protein BSKO_07447 [Bryopsis sp. KO-2023]|nr:hypothetical protein BSKO_07447 [Bryopsis sp. KO-2023]